MDKFSPEAFKKACHAADGLGLRVEHDGQEQRADVWFHKRPFALVGRNPGNDVLLTDRRISRRHAYLQVLGGEVFCVDLNSRTGTHWPEGPRAAGWLLPQQSIRLGGHALSLLGTPVGNAPLRSLDPMVRGCLQNSPITLEFLGQRWNQTRWPMNRILAILGTAPWCNIRLHDAQVAPVHASLVATAQGTWVVDLLSPRGTWLNGQQIQLARLEDGDELQIGDFQMRVHCEPGNTFALKGCSEGLVREAASVPESGRLLACDTLETDSATVTEHPALPEPAAAPPEPALAPVPVPGVPPVQHRKTGMDLVPSGHPIAPAMQAANPSALQHVVEHTAKAMLESVFFPMVQQFSAVQNQMFDQFQQSMTLMFQMFGSLQKDQMQLVRTELNRVQELTEEIQSLHAELKAKAAVPPGPPLPKSRALADSAPTNGTSHGSFAPSPPVNGTSPTLVSQSTSETSEQSAEDVHAWLCQRMAELQDDRRSRLQKIADFLSGK